MKGKSRSPGSGEARSIWPLPGGTAKYIATLQRFLQLCSDRPSRTDFTERVLREFPTVRSAQSVRSYVQYVLIPLDLVQSTADTIELTTNGRAFLRQKDPRRKLASLLEKQIWGVSDLLTILQDEPKTIGSLSMEMQDRGFPWKSDWQIRYRLNWLRAVGVVVRNSEKESPGRYPTWTLSGVLTRDRAAR